MGLRTFDAISENKGIWAVLCVTLLLVLYCGWAICFSKSPSVVIFATFPRQALCLVVIYSLICMSYASRKTIDRRKTVVMLIAFAVIFAILTLSTFHREVMKLREVADTGHMLHVRSLKMHLKIVPETRQYYLYERLLGVAYLIIFNLLCLVSFSGVINLVEFDESLERWIFAGCLAVDAFLSFDVMFHTGMI